MAFHSLGRERGDSMVNEHWQMLTESFPQLLEYGIKVTIPLTIPVTVALIQYANVRFLRRLCRFYIWITRGTPLLVQLFIVFYGLPDIGIKLSNYLSAFLVLGFNEGAYMAETMRGALESVPRGQMEAGYCAGMNYVQIMGHVVLPQAFRTAFPALGNSMIAMVKDTSMAASITMAEMFRQAQIISGQRGDVLLLYCEAAVIYLLFCTALTWLQRLGEKLLAKRGGVRA